MDKIALVIGANADAIHMIQLAKARGLYVIAVDNNPNAEGLMYADRREHVDITNRKDMIELVEKTKPNYILPVPIGRWLTVIGFLNSYFHLPGIEYEAVMKSTDKALFHKELQKHGLHQVFQYVVNESLDGNLVNVQYPVIVKPRFGSGSRDVKVIENFKQLKIYLDKDKLRREDFLVEQYVEGIEYGVSGVVIEGELQLSLIRKKINTPFPSCQAIGYITGVDSTKGIVAAKIYEKLKDVVAILHYNNCFVQADVIVKDDRIFVIEIAPRPSGHYIYNCFEPLAIGVNIADEYIKFLMGEWYSFKTRYIKCMRMCYFNFNNVKIKGVPTEAKLRLNKNCNLVSWNCNIAVGDKLEEVENGHNIMGRGYFIVEGVDEVDLQRQEAWVMSQFKVEKI